MNTTKNKPIEINNRLAYFSFFIIGLCLAIFSDDYAWGASLISLAIIFDPFDNKVPWKERPLYQKAVPIFHLVVAIGLIIYSLITIVGQ